MKNSHKNKLNIMANIIFTLVFASTAIFIIYWILNKTLTTDVECTIESVQYVETGGGGSFAGHSPKLFLTCQDNRRYEMSELPESQRDFHEYQHYLEGHKGHTIKLTVAAIRDPFNGVYNVNDIDLSPLDDND